MTKKTVNTFLIIVFLIGLFFFCWLMFGNWWSFFVLMISLSCGLVLFIILEMIIDVGIGGIREWYNNLPDK